MGKLRDAVTNLVRSIDLFPEVSSVLATRAELRARVDPLPNLLDEPEDIDVAWAVARVAFAVGNPASRDPVDLNLVAERTLEAILLARAKLARFYRIGDPKWIEHLVFCLFPVQPGQDGDRAILLPVPPRGLVYEPSAPGLEWVATLDGKRVPWPSFNPPLVRDLMSDNTHEADRSGFVRKEKAVPGDSRLPPDVAVRSGA